MLNYSWNDTMLLVLLQVICITVGISLGLSNIDNATQEDPAVTNLRAYLRIPTVHPHPEPGYEQAIKWLREQSEELGLDFYLVGLGEGVPHSFALWLTWQGSDPSLKSVLLNSHMDVVYAESEKWEHDPFEAYKDVHGNIYARGATDMKSATIAQLEAIRKLKRLGFQPLRTIHVAIIPDEEMLGKRGMRPFTNSDYFKALNVGIDIDEGYPGGMEHSINISFTEKSVWQFNVTAIGKAQHASMLPQFTAGHRLQMVINQLFAFREAELQKLQSPNVTLLDLTTLNLVRLGGGTGDNIIPNELWATFDMRIRLKPNWTFADVENMIFGIAKEARLGSLDGVSVNWIIKAMEAGETVADDSNIWWKVVQNTCHELSITCTPIVLPAATDGRFVREKNIPTFGICPFPSMKMMAHEVNEFINEDHFLEGIPRYMAFIKNFASLPRNPYSESV